MGANRSARAGSANPDVVFFGAPHGTPYPGLDNTIHADSASALRRAIAEDGKWLDHWDFDLGGPVFAGRDFQLSDWGDLATRAADGVHNRALIEATTRAILAQAAVPIMVGGDDSVPIPFLAAFDNRGPLTILQIDAHIDWRDERRGERFGFSSTMRRASEMAHVEKIIQVGIRGLGSARATELQLAERWGAKIIPARTVHADGIAGVVDLIPEGGRVVMTLDCDAFDAGIMAAVVSPTPGGLGYHHVIDLIGAIVQKAQLVGFDLIEFVPARDPDGACSYLAARIIWHVVGRLARRAAPA